METLTEAAAITTDGTLNWDNFFKNYWKKEPILFKKPFDKKILTEEDIMQLLRIQGERIRNYIGCDITFYDSDRVAVNGRNPSKRHLTGLEELLPTKKDIPLSTYLQKVTRYARFQEYCIYINGAHIYEHIWKKFRHIFKIIFDYTEISPIGMNTDIFLGNYSKTNFGAHKDKLDNFMFMIFGSRRMLLWHDKIWKSKLGNPDDDEYLLLDYELFRPYAISVNLEPGDILYWPSDYWHVGENLEQVSGSFNIDFYVSPQKKILDSVIASSMQKIINQEVFRINKRDSIKKININPNHSYNITVPYNLNRQFENLLSKLVEQEHNRLQLKSEWLKKVSAFGFQRGIEIRGSILDCIDRNSQIITDPEFPILYSIHNKDLILIAYHGNVKILPYSKILKTLIQKLNEGEVISVIDLHSQIQMDNKNDVDFETFKYLVDILYQIHAIELLA